MHQSLLLLFVCLLAFTTTHAQIITTMAGGGTVNPGNGGRATDAVLTTPTGIAIDAMGNYYICERDAHRVRKVAADGTISLFAGIGSSGYSGDGGLATAARLYKPYSIVIDQYNNVYIGDVYSVRKVNAMGVISTIAGIGIEGYSGDNGPATAAKMTAASGLALDGWGNLFIADIDNSRVRKVDPLGIITTVAGTGSLAIGDDNVPATTANLASPAGIAVDYYGNIYVADDYHHKIRKISRDGMISTIAGNGVAGYSGDNEPATSAQLRRPISICVDRLGNLYISDTYNYRIRKIRTSGVIATVAGNGLSAFYGDGGDAELASIVTPVGLTLDPSGSLYIADFGNSRIRKVTDVVSVNDVDALGPEIGIYPNPTNGSFSINAPTQAAIPIRIIDCLGREVYRQTVMPNASILLPGHLPGGVYVLAATIDGVPCVQQSHVIR